MAYIGTCKRLHVPVNGFFYLNQNVMKSFDLSRNGWNVDLPTIFFAKFNLAKPAPPK